MNDEVRFRNITKTTTKTIAGEIFFRNIKKTTNKMTISTKKITENTAKIMTPYFKINSSNNTSGTSIITSIVTSNNTSRIKSNLTAIYTINCADSTQKPPSFEYYVYKIGFFVIVCAVVLFSAVVLAFFMKKKKSKNLLLILIFSGIGTKIRN